MNEPPPSGSEPGSLLEQISTRWSLIANPMQFVLRYAPAIRRYLGALVRNQHDAEEVAQDFLLHMVKAPLLPARASRGRFRDYLKAALRNAATDHFRRRPLHGDEDLLKRIPAPQEATADKEWLDQWRHCLLERAWEGLQDRERASPGNLGYSALRLASEHPDDESAALADRLAKKTGRTLRPEAFRKQLSRARQCFAQLIVDMVRQTLEDPRPELVLEELSDLGLMTYVRAYLPARWRKP